MNHYIQQSKSKTEQNDTYYIALRFRLMVGGLSVSVCAFGGGGGGGVGSGGGSCSLTKPLTFCWSLPV